MHRVLIVSSDDVERRGTALALEIALGPSGYDSGAGLLVAVKGVGTRWGAVLSLALEPPDVLVLDATMCTKRELEYVVKKARGRGTAYVLLIDSDANALAKVAHEVGANGYLTRPLSVSTLQEQIRYWLAPRSSVPPGEKRR